MNTDNALQHRFVEYMPPELEDGVLYVSMSLRLAMHRCCCGCGNEISTTLSPRRWSLTFDGETVSLCPSIGNRQLPCRTHYWIKKSRVYWLPPYTDDGGYGNAPVDRVEDIGKSHGRTGKIVRGLRLLFGRLRRPRR